MEKRDLQKDLDRFNELWEMDFLSGDVAEFAGKVLPHAINRALEAECKLSEQHSYEGRVRNIYNLSPDVGFEDLAKTRAELIAELEKAQARMKALVQLVQGTLKGHVDCCTPYQRRIKELEELIVKIEERCDWIDRDKREPDKVMCGTQSIRFIIAPVYPKYNSRGGGVE